MLSSMEIDRSPLLVAKNHLEPSVFLPENLLREGRRQRRRPEVDVPAVCLLDPDGDIVAHLEQSGRGQSHPGWGCYHTALSTFDLNGRELGIVGSAVGAPFAVLVAEQMMASGCELVLSIASAGSIAPVADRPPFVVIDQALRDEGTSHHYLPPATWAPAPPRLIEQLSPAIDGVDAPVGTGSSWTTDAPYRETEAAIAGAAAVGATVVEMEAAGLYAFAAACDRDVLCVAHVTNTMATAGDDFEKGPDDGASDALAVVSTLLDHLRPAAGR